MSDARHYQQFQDAIQQKQFLDVIGRDEATARFRQHLDCSPRGAETVPLHAALNRVLARDVSAPIDVPAFDRSNVDGFAVQAADTSGAMEEATRVLTINPEVLSPGVVPQIEVRPGTATPIATGGMMPRGADAVLMIEYTQPAPSVADPDSLPQILLQHAVASGQMVSYAGSDIARGETVLRRGQLLTSRETGVLAALGCDTVDVWKRPSVAIISTGDEIVPPGQPLPLGSVYDSNAAILAAAVTELGCEPVLMGQVQDDVDQLRNIVTTALQYDAVLLSGGTSKGAGDLSGTVVHELTDPGVVAHGVALKPGKPICLAVTNNKPVVVLPGFPTSAIFTFHEFVAPVLRSMAGLPTEDRTVVEATLPVRVNSDRGRTEYLLVGLVRGDDGLSAWPMGKGSGSVTTFSQADGFIVIDQHTEMLDEGSQVQVHISGRNATVPDLVVIGSHCTGLDFLLGELRREGITARVLSVGSMGGVHAARRGECDIAGVHLLDAVTGIYNQQFATDRIHLVQGYRRRQGVVFRRDDDRFADRSLEQAMRAALDSENCSMINRNAGSGTRVLIDELLTRHGVSAMPRPPGYSIQTKSHNATATAIQQGRADWGVAIASVARDYGLGFIPLQDECYDFLIPATRWDRPAVALFRSLLERPETAGQLKRLMAGVAPD